MSSNEDILTLAGQAKNFPPAAADRRPSTFLSLAPATSSSYPQKKAAAPEAADTATSETVANTVDTKQRRSSSLSSSNSNPASNGLRILKLGPVHWGEHLGDHQQDWHEVAIE